MDIDRLRLAAQLARDRIADLDKPAHELSLANLEVKQAIVLESLVGLAMDLEAGAGTEFDVIKAVRELGKLSWEREFRYAEEPQE